MKCSQVKKRLSAFMDNELDGTTSDTVEEHLATCYECLKYLQELTEVDDLVSSLPMMDPDPRFSDSLVSAAMHAPLDSDPETMPLSSFLRDSARWVSKTIHGLIEPCPAPNTGTLEEFGDFPPLSMSSIYLKLLDQGSEG